MPIPPSIPKTAPSQPGARPPFAQQQGAPAQTAPQSQARPSASQSFSSDISKMIPRQRTPSPFIAQPLRGEGEEARDPVQFKSFLNAVALRFPNLKKQLLQADMHYTPAGYVQRALFTAAVIDACPPRNPPLFIPILLLLLIVYFGGGFLYAMQFPSVKAKGRAKRMEQEIVFAGRHMLIELKSGVPLFDSMLGISRDYGEVSLEFNKIVEKG